MKLLPGGQKGLTEWPTLEAVRVTHNQVWHDPETNRKTIKCGFSKIVAEATQREPFMQIANQRWSPTRKGRKSAHGTTRGGEVAGAIPSAIGWTPRPWLKVRVYTGNPKPHIELAIHWFSKNKQEALALVHTRAERTFTYAKHNHFQGSVLAIDGYIGSTVWAEQTPLVLQVGQLPSKRYVVHIALIPEYILGMDILVGLTLNTTAEELRLQCKVVKVIAWGQDKWSPVRLPFHSLPNEYPAILRARGQRRDNPHYTGIGKSEHCSPNPYWFEQFCVAHAKSKWHLEDDCGSLGME